MATRLRPELDIWIYPLEAVQVPGSPPLTLVDKLSALPREPEGEERSGDPPWWRPAVTYGGVVSGSPELWCQPGRLYDIHGLRWWTFTDPITGQEVGVFTLAPHLLAWMTYIDQPDRALVLPTTKWFLHGFKRVRGWFWQNVTPDDGEEAQAIAWYANGAPGSQYTYLGDDGVQHTDTLEALPEDPADKYGGALYIAQSVHKHPAGQSFAVKLWLGAPAPGTAPWVRIAWADDRYSVLLQQGLPPVLSVGHPGTTHYWRRADTAKEASGDWFPSREPVWVSVFHVAGRILVRIWGGKHDYTLVYSELRYDRRGNATPTGVVSPAGHITVSGAWAPVTLRMYEVLWGLRAPWKTHTEKVGDTTRTVIDKWQILNTGWFRRKFHAWRRSGEPKGWALGDPASYGRARGLSRTFLERHSVARVEVGEPGFSGTDSAAIDRLLLELIFGRPAQQQDRGVLEYKCTLGTGAGYPLEYESDDEDSSGAGNSSLQGSNDGPFRGCVTPAVHSVVVQYASAWRRVSASPLNIRPAVVSASETVEDPMLSPGPSWRLRLARELLPDCELADGTRVGDSWTQYVQRYHPARVDVRWRLSDGSTTQAVRRLEGYVWRRDISSRPGPAQREASIELRDWSLRLQKPAGIVDGRFPPLDAILFANAARMSPGSMPVLYGAHAVRAILECALGPDVAGRLEYYYQDASLDWSLLDSHDAGAMPLLDYRVITGEIPSAGFWFPPPWGRSVLDWIRQIADYDVGVFFFAWSPNSGRFVPTYGNYFAIVQNAPTHTLNADDLDADQPVEEAEIAQVSEHDINRILIWGRIPGGDQSYRDIMPALGLISAEARIEAGSAIPEQNINQTWERTLIKDGTQYWLPRVAQVVAHVALMLYRDVEVARYVLRTRGIPDLWWGHKVQIGNIGAGADPWLQKLAGHAYRVMRIHNEYDLQRGLWESRVNVVPQPAGG